MAARIYSAGQLSQRIKFQERGVAASPLQEEVGAWVDLWTPVWAMVEPLSGRDFLAAGAMQNAVTTRIVMRYRAGIVGREDLRVVWLNTMTPHEIVSALPVDGGRDWIEIMAIAGVRDGR
ncbi:phage head closure protein [Nostoc sp. NIES-2111]